MTYIARGGFLNHSQSFFISVLITVLGWIDVRSCGNRACGISAQAQRLCGVPNISSYCERQKLALKVIYR